MDDLVTYTTWSGARVLHRHLPSGNYAFPMLTSGGEVWVVMSPDKQHTNNRFATEEEALVYLASLPPGPGGVELTLMALSRWAEGYEAHLSRWASEAQESL